MKQKLIVTLWRAQIDAQSTYKSLFCRLSYANQSQDSHPISSSQTLIWKQTFIFALSRLVIPLKIDIINMHEIKQIHFAEDQILDGLSIGKSEVMIGEQNSYNKGPIPAKLPIKNQQGTQIGTIFIQYEILKTQVTYVVQKLIDYQYLMKVKSFKLTFVRKLLTIPAFYLKFMIGKKTQKEDFPFQHNQKEDIYTYNYPIQFFIKNDIEMDIEIQMKENTKEGLKKLNASMDSDANSNTIKSARKQGKKNTISIQSAQKITTNLDLNFKQNGIYQKKIPVYMAIKKHERQIGTLQFDAQIIFRTKQEKQQYHAQKKKQDELRNLGEPDASKKKERKQPQIKSNGHIIVNSIIQKLQLFNEQFIKNKNSSIELKLGKVSQNSTLQNNPGKQAIYMDTFIFKRTWEEIMKFVVYIYDGNQKLPKFYTELNLRQLFQVGRFMTKKVQLIDEVNNYCGYLVLDIAYRDQNQKSPQKPAKKNPQKSADKLIDLSRQQKQQFEKQIKKQKILQRMKNKQEIKLKRQKFMNYGLPADISTNDIVLPPLRNNSRYLTQSKSTISPRKGNMSINLYNNGGAQFFSKSPRFQSAKKDYEADSYLFKPESDFEIKRRRGASIGSGQKYDFTKEYQRSPGVGMYHIPSVWDKYRK